MARVSRRRFLVGSGAVAGAAVLGGCSGDEPPAPTGTSPGAVPSGSASPGSSPVADLDPQDWDSVRAQFPLTTELAHFNAWVFASPPRQVGDAITEHRRQLDLDTSGYQDANQTDLDAAVLSAAGDYLGVDAAEIATTDSTTMGLGLVYGGLRLRADQHVLTTTHDFYSTHEALRLTAERTGATVDRVTLYADPSTASADEMVARIADGITPQTRVVAVTWVHSSTGVKLPVAQVAAAVAAANEGRDEDDRALLFVDGVHGFGVEDATPADLGCDVLVSGTHKWLFGPRGTGIVWASPTAWSLIAPVIPSFSSDGLQAWLDEMPPTITNPGQFGTPGGFHTLEYRWAVAEAFRFHAAIGKDRVQQRTHEQATQLKEGLASVPGVRVATPMSTDLSSGMVCIGFDSANPFELLRGLREDGFVAGLTPTPTGYLRAGPSLVTTPDQVEGLVAAIAARV